jgi:NAD(P)H-dependent flavin oxidoreductase YrpB (nitropropane dioxygenase family)
MAEMMDKYGADGIQIASRFVLSDECDVADEFKQAYLDAKKDDIVITSSPVGLPGRAIKTTFVQAIAKGVDLTAKKCKHLCLKKCDHHYCINERLTAARKGDLEEGLYFSGENTYKMKSILPVAEIFKQFISQAESVYKEQRGYAPPA